ncbi:hypothetical protein XA68_17948 [Ophiocordyceps unilateralis]|uniref:Uncharacterized protein n=1 Tax=Ophiocordyceps unilateralis TaxID=268505 RepID=A0A2A9P2E8_OPHUN|nr:hypothetical protein XA68_17948 [Ophiocordyceps unilateralis]
MPRIGCGRRGNMGRRGSTAAGEGEGEGEDEGEGEGEDATPGRQRQTGGEEAARAGGGGGGGGKSLGRPGIASAGRWHMKDAPDGW